MGSINKFYKMSYSRYQYRRGRLEDKYGEDIIPVPSQYVLIDNFVYFGLAELYWSDMDVEDEITEQAYIIARDLEYPPNLYEFGNPEQQ